jgi:hypothetical protein
VVLRREEDEGECQKPSRFSGFCKRKQKLEHAIVGVNDCTGVTRRKTTTNRPETEDEKNENE